MKNQYFADKKDHFKYDLMITLTESLPGMQRFTYIPMLTPDDKKQQGNQTKYPQLHQFLRDSIDMSSRNITRLRDYFKVHEGFRYSPYADDRVFEHAKRKAYFEEIPHNYFQKAVILVDPDIGLETESRTGSQHIKYDEIRGIHSRMDNSSILVIFQYFPRAREEKESYLSRRCCDLVLRLGCPLPLAIHDKQIAFLIIAKDDNRYREVWPILRTFWQGGCQVFDPRVEGEHG